MFYQKYVENSSLEDAFLEFKPDILIIDEHLQYFITDNPENSFLEELHLRKTDLNMLLSKYAQLRGTVQVDAVTLSVYQFVWPDD